MLTFPLFAESLCAGTRVAKVPCGLAQPQFAEGPAAAVSDELAESHVAAFPASHQPPPLAVIPHRVPAHPRWGARAPAHDNGDAHRVPAPRAVRCAAAAYVAAGPPAPALKDGAVWRRGGVVWDPRARGAAAAEGEAAWGGPRAEEQRVCGAGCVERSGGGAPEFADGPCARGRGVVVAQRAEWGEWASDDAGKHAAAVGGRAG